MSHLKPQRITLLLMALVLLVGWQPVVGMQINRLLDYNVDVSGIINDTTPEDKWTFTANGSDRITITVDRIDGTLVPHLELQNQSGKIITSADHDETFARATIAPLILPSPGTYTVVISRYKGKDGKTSGNYKLNATLLGIGADYGGASVIQGLLHIGNNRKGSLGNSHWFDLWTLQVDAIQPLTMTITRISDTLVPTLVILDANKKEVAHAVIDDTFATTSLKNFTPKQTGQYTVVVSRAGDIAGETTGDYELSINTP